MFRPGYNNIIIICINLDFAVKLSLNLVLTVVCIYLAVYNWYNLEEEGGWLAMHPIHPPASVPGLLALNRLGQVVFNVIISLQYLSNRIFALSTFIRDVLSACITILLQSPTPG